MTDEQAIDAAENDREHGHLDPVSDEQLAAAQDRYERLIGWTHD